MKKITLLMLLAILVLPMNAKISSTIKAYQANQTKEVVNKAKRGDAAMPKAVQVDGRVATLKAVAPKADGSMTWDFEDAEAGFTPFTVEDKDGDGFNWEYYNNTGLTEGRMTAHEGEGLIASASYDNDSETALNPNNWLISPELTLGGALKFWAVGQDASWCDEVFGVYVTVDGTTWAQVGTDKTATGEYVEYEFDLSAYAGQTGKFAIVHHNVTDMFFLNVDDITFDPNSVVTPEPIIPTDVAVTPTATTGEVVWVPGENNGSWDLRWRPYTDPALMNRDWSDMNLDNYQQMAADFSAYDADGDGNYWGFSYADDGQYNVCFSSSSWTSSTGALSPDNWLITPEVPLGGTLKFKVANASGTYQDKIKVYVCDNPEFESLDEFVAISEDIKPGTAWVEYEFDLSEYEGTGFIAFRHYDSNDMMSILVDDIVVEIPGAIEPSEWTVVENVTSPYTIEGLTPETEYEVQVMAYNEEGDKQTDWTESVRFFTLAEEEFPPLYIIGEVNGNSWAPNVGVEMETADGQIYTKEVVLERPAEGIMPKVDEVEGNEYCYFSFATQLADEWAGLEPYRIGAVSEASEENPNADFRFYKDMMGQPLALTEGNHAFQVEEGTYTLTVDMEAMTLTIVGQSKTAIETINVDNKVKSGRFNLLGQPVNENYKGIVIENGVKKIQK